MTLTSEALPVVMPTEDLIDYATTDCALEMGLLRAGAVTGYYRLKGYPVSLEGLIGFQTRYSVLSCQSTK